MNSAQKPPFYPPKRLNRSAVISISSCILQYLPINKNPFRISYVRAPPSIIRRNHHHFYFSPLLIGDIGCLSQIAQKEHDPATTLIRREIVDFLGDHLGHNNSKFEKSTNALNMTISFLYSFLHERPSGSPTSTEHSSEQGPDYSGSGQR